MKQFKYLSNHPCHLTLKVNDEYRDFSLFKDEVYELPETNSVVQRMQAQKLLEQIPALTSTINTPLKNKKSNGS